MLQKILIFFEATSFYIIIFIVQQNYFQICISYIWIYLYQLDYNKEKTCVPGLKLMFYIEWFP